MKYIIRLVPAYKHMEPLIYSHLDEATQKVSIAVLEAEELGTNISDIMRSSGWSDLIIGSKIKDHSCQPMHPALYTMVRVEDIAVIEVVPWRD